MYNLIFKMALTLLREIAAKIVLSGGFFTVSITLVGRVG